MAKTRAQVKHCTVPPRFYAQGHAANGFMHDDTVLEIGRADTAVYPRVVLGLDVHQDVFEDLFCKGRKRVSQNRIQ